MGDALRVLALDQTTRPLAEQALGRLLDEGARLRPFWLATLDQPLAGNDLALVLADDDAAHAIALVGKRPYGAEGRNTVFFVPEHPRRARYYEQLNAAVLARLAARGLRWNHTEVREGNPDIALLQTLGYACLETVQEMLWSGAPYACAPVPGVRIEHYRGGDPDFGAAVAALCNEFFRRELVWQQVNGAAFEAQLREGDSDWYVAVDEASGQPIAVSAISPQHSFCHSIGVVREHRGRGIAEYIACHTMDRAREQGLQRLYSDVRAANLISIKLHRRMGWEENGRRVTLRIAVPADRIGEREPGP